MLDIIWSYVLPFFIMVNVIVLIHSIGHLIGAKLFNTAVEVVSVGLWLKLYEFTWKNSLWKICWLPIGGYVRTRIEHTDEGTYAKKICVSLFGPFVSLLSAAIVFLVLFVTQGAPSIDNGDIVLVPQSASDGIMAAMRALVWTWTTWRPEATGAFVSFYDTPAYRVICLTAIWSSKFGILNLLPIPKFDGWKVLGLVMAAFTDLDRADKAMKLVLRIEIILAVLGLGYVILNDLANLLIFSG